MDDDEKRESIQLSTRTSCRQAMEFISLNKEGEKLREFRHLNLQFFRLIFNLLHNVLIKSKNIVCLFAYFHYISLIIPFFLFNLNIVKHSNFIKQQS